MPRRAPRRRRARKGKGNRRSRTKARKPSQMARIVETIEFNKLSPNNMLNCSFTINQFERARTLATNFRWYKPTKVVWTLEPQYNVFQGASGGAPSVPYLYTIMNRTQDATLLTLSDFLSQGAKPHKLTAPKTISYRPNWCVPGLIVQNVLSGPGFGGYLNNVFMNGLKASYDWLQAPNNLPSSQQNPGQVIPLQPLLTPANTAVNVIPGATVFNGHQFFISQQLPPTTSTSLFKVNCQVHWSFKDPKNVLAEPGDNIFADLSGNEDITSDGTQIF